VNDNEKGIAYMLLSSLFFALMAGTVKFLGEIPLAEKIFFRNLVGMFIAVYMIRKNGNSIKANNIKMVLFRSLFGVLSVAAYFYGISQLKMADAVILNKISPFFIIVLAAVFLKEEIGKPQMAALAFAVVGAVFVIKPRFDASIIPALVTLSSGIFAGTAHTILRYLRKSDSADTIVFYFCGFATLVTIPFMFFGDFVVPTVNEMLALFAVGVFGVVAQFFVTNAYRLAPAGEVSIYAYSNIIFSAVIGIFLFSEIPDGLSIFGGSVIILAGFINFQAGRKKKKKAGLERKKRLSSQAS